MTISRLEIRSREIRTAMESSGLFAAELLAEVAHPDRPHERVRLLAFRGGNCRALEIGTLALWESKHPFVFESVCEEYGIQVESRAVAA